jgi:hypothetical protein
MSSLEPHVERSGPDRTGCFEHVPPRGGGGVTVSHQPASSAATWSTSCHLAGAGRFGLL